MSDFNTYEITVKVAIRVSAYDKEHAVDVASELLTPVAGVMSVKGNDSSTLLEKVKAEYDKSYGIYERLERDTFDSSNEESYDDTVNRIYNQGYSDALLTVIKQLEKGE
jgi:hypothetical protein